MDLGNNKNIKDFLDNIIIHIKNKDVHKEVKMEFESHILEIVYEFIDNGLSEEKAIEEAIKRMGDAKKIGERLNKVHKPRPDYVTILLTIGLLSIGVLTMYSLMKNDLVSKGMIYKNLLSAILGGVVGICIYKFDYRKIKKYSYHMYLLMIVLLLIDKILNPNTYGINTISNSILLPSTMIFLISLSGIIQLLDLSKIKNIMILIILSIIPMFTLMAIPNATMVLFYIFTVNIIFFMSKPPKKYKLGVIAIELLGIITVFLKILTTPHLTDRLLAFMPGLFRNMFNHSGTYIQTESMKLLDNATLFGQNIGQSNLSISMLRTDLIFTAIAYSLGWIMAIVSLVVIVAFLVRNFVLVFKVKDNFGKLVTASIVSMLSLQSIATILYSLGLSPLTFGMPFISSGGTNIFTNCIMIGILSSVYRRKSLVTV
ncbi:FtsW/RodA/SpoVE family cell cycle protein [Clostridium sp. CCUG 7971]|uniref:FtsW/RodA/SpoVE family cell cycle protein n=1 Tax=Clostridium sp. CCUG 7971 TaxID=2811414 RepID=UPI001ABBDF85|nr:FtsW/RodA/SpoVE family cell cycle protein [Clostridium sp. CCUG 7971]MBO3446127.1 FtsW/RodA/SpoVE family cell cycle protein [Clostridium sp. CCUG 7971]